LHGVFHYDHYLLRRQVLALTGKFRIYSPSGQLLLYSEQKMFRLREDIRVYSDENLSQELLCIKARQIIDFSAAYDVIDSLSGARVGVIRRKGLRSMVRDEWHLLDADEHPLAVMQEDDLKLALLRRFLLGVFLPQNYDILSNGQRLVDVRQRFNLFRYELDIDFSPDPDRRIDRRLGIAAGILLAAIEGRQDS
jgi:uncharacterized protein YxjI